MNKIRELIKSYIEDEISITEFQSRLERRLGNYEILSKDDDDFIRKVINDIERILYTIRLEDQKESVTRLFPEIIDFVQNKDERKTLRSSGEKK